MAKETVDMIYIEDKTNYEIDPIVWKVVDNVILIHNGKIKIYKLQVEEFYKS